MHEVLVNRLGGLSLPRKSVVRLTDRPDMTLDVYRGRKTTIQQQQSQTKIAADDILIFSFYLSMKIRLDFSCESSAWQRIHLKYQVLFSLKNNEKIFMNVICCSRDCLFKG